MKSFERFTEKLNKFSPVKLDQTQQVLRERSRLSQNIEILSGKLKLALNKTEAIKHQYQVINGLKIDINDSKNYEIETRVPDIKKVPFSESGRYMTTCLICIKTCHIECCIKDDDDKRGCACIDDNGYCVMCPKKCHWTEHKNRPYKLVSYMKTVKTTLNDLKKKYVTSGSKLDKKTQILNGTLDELLELNSQCLNIQDQLFQSINRLKEIALNKNVFSSAEEYIDLMIEKEKNEHMEGWESRIEGLNILKKQKKLLRDYSEGNTGDVAGIRKFLQECITKNKDLKDFVDKLGVGKKKTS